mmetsp:Transcript_129841/g.242820  ORF Transcript_129841/g.242820 Transcript_129841/m.242820 type:complete len:111 (-) Transcript_129841:357-689(-)
MSAFQILEKESESIACEEALKIISGTWYIKDVSDPVTLEVVDGEVRSKGNFLTGQTFVGKPRAGKDFVIDIQMGGFPMVATMKKKGGDLMLLFSNSGIWTKDSPLKTSKL